MTALKNNYTEKSEKIFIFDTNIFLTGLDFNIISSLIYTTPSVIQEIKIKKYAAKNRNIINRIEAATASKKLLIREPSIEFIKKVEEHSKITGDLAALSNTDREIIALALELKIKKSSDVIVYTNDYSMENLCSDMNIPFSAMLGKEGIKNKIVWEAYCPFCDEIYEAEYLFKKCEQCGTTIKRRPKK